MVSKPLGRLVKWYMEEGFYLLRIYVTTDDEWSLPLVKLENSKDDRLLMPINPKGLLWETLNI